MLGDYIGERSGLYLPYLFPFSLSILPPSCGQGIPCLNQEFWILGDKKEARGGCPQSLGLQWSTHFNEMDHILEEKETPWTLLNFTVCGTASSCWVRWQFAYVGEENFLWSSSTSQGLIWMNYRLQRKQKFFYMKYFFLLLEWAD